jgi:hypothetical protein
MGLPELHTSWCDPIQVGQLKKYLHEGAKELFIRLKKSHVKDDLPLIITASNINLSISNNSNIRGIDGEHQCVVIVRQSKLI